jgi:hypothetical protein
MKKSDAIFKLKHELYGPTNSKEALAKTNEILNFVENVLKMVPPIIDEESFKILEHGEMTYAVHKWELENE